jgi:hypothetical protein
MTSYTPNNTWYIQTMNSVLELGGALVRPEVAHHMLRIIAESGADSAAGTAVEDIRHHAVESYLSLLARQSMSSAAAAAATGSAAGSGASASSLLPSMLLQVLAWVCGEYAHTAASVDAAGVGLQLAEVLSHASALDMNTRAWLLTAVGKVMAHQPHLWQRTVGSGSATAVADVVRSLQTSVSTDVQQRAYEIIELSQVCFYALALVFFRFAFSCVCLCFFPIVLLQMASTMRAVFPLDASAQQTDVDEELSFLNGMPQSCQNTQTARCVMPFLFSFSEWDTLSRLRLRSAIQWRSSVQGTFDWCR